jgi:hypothetical protein
MLADYEPVEEDPDIPFFRGDSSSSAVMQPYFSDAYRYLSPCELSRLLQEKLRVVEESAGVCRDEALLLLREYHWDVEQFQNRHLFEAALPPRPPPPRDPRPDCPACLEDKPLLLAECGHALCPQCWQDYIAAQLPSSSVFIHCPDTHCPQSLRYSFLLRFDPLHADI